MGIKQEVQEYLREQRTNVPFGMMIGMKINESTHSFGISICNPKDDWCKHVAYILAYEASKESKIIVPPKVEWNLVKTFLTQLERYFGTSLDQSIVLA